MTNIASFLKKSMHISINTFLPSVNLHIGNPDDDKYQIRILVDTVANMNTRI